jgi:hypothetical protein
MTQVRGKLLACVAGLVVFGFAAATASADQLLTGSITSATGQKLEGVQVAASDGPYNAPAARDPCRPARLRAVWAPECQGTGSNSIATYNQRAATAVAYRIRYLRVKEEQKIVRRTGAPQDLATGECLAMIPVDRHGNIRGAVSISCTDPDLARLMREAVRLAAPYVTSPDVEMLTVRVRAPVTQPGVNG